MGAFLSKRQRASLGHARRRIAQMVGSKRYSHVGIQAIEACLARYLPPTGVFVEAGANDGIWQSNTYWLECRGWTGVLIEPIPELYDKCRRTRPHATVVNCALVSDDCATPTVEMIYAGLMSIVVGAQGSTDADEHHIATGERNQTICRYTIDVRARRLGDVLADAGIRHVDLLSLDVEGYELEVLRGLDIGRFCPDFILVEASTAERGSRIERHLAVTHEMLEQPTATDFLYRVRR